MTDKLIPGTIFEVSKIVGKEDTAEFHGSGDLPVYATPALVALMEYAAKELVKKGLAPGETTVGTKMDITHLKATPVGNEVSVKAELSEIQGRKMSFTIEAYDKEILIGQAVHERVVVDRERFMTRVSK